MQTIELREEVRSALQELAEEASSLHGAVLQHVTDQQSVLVDSTKKFR